MKGKIYSVTVTYNPSIEDRKLERQIRFLLENEIVPIIVDNGSDNVEDLRELLLIFADKVKMIGLDRNYGIGKALNIGIKDSLKNDDCKWILTLDQDTFFKEDSFQRMQYALEKYDNDQLGIIGFNYEKTRFNKKYLANRTCIPRFTNFTITSGSLAKRTVYELVKYDEDLFMYFLDDDLCQKVRKIGYKIMILSDAFIIHSEGERVYRHNEEFFVLNPNRFFYVGRNSIIMSLRYHTIRPILYLIFLFLENIFAGFYLSDTFVLMIRGIFNGIYRNENRI